MNESISICFICLNGNTSLKAILQNGSQNDTALQVQYVLPEVTIWDSVYICSLCCNSLHSFYSFKKKCLENYRRLMHKTDCLQGTSDAQAQKLTEIQIETCNMKHEQNMDTGLNEELIIKEESEYLSPLVQEQGDQRTFADANMEDLIVSEDNSESECFPQPEFVKCEIDSDCEQDCSSSVSGYKNTFDKEETHIDNENYTISENSDLPQEKESCKDSKRPRKTCFVPSCGNTSENTNKIFLTVPKLYDNRRSKWFAQINQVNNNTTVFYCCEDHFNLPEDVDNWIHYKEFGRAIIVKKNVVPHLYLTTKKNSLISQVTASSRKRKHDLHELRSRKSHCKSANKRNHNLNIIDYSSTSSSNSEHNDCGHRNNTQQTGKKRIRRDEIWPRNMRKKLRTEGKSYKNVKGAVVAEKKIGANCNCKLKCFDKIGPKITQKLFEEFYNLPQKDMQDAYLFKCIKVKEVSRNRPRSGEGKTKRVTHIFTVRNGQMEYNICKKAFLAFHAVTKSRIERLQKHMADNVTSPIDKRGKHNNRPNKISQDILEKIQAIS